MDTDSDSGGSHISATPPRTRRRPSPPPQTISRRPTPLTSAKAKNRVRASLKFSNPTTSTLKQPSPEPPPPNISHLFSESFQIRRCSDQIESIGYGAPDSVPALAGRHASRVSFSKMQRPSLTFETESPKPDTESPKPDSRVSQEKPKNIRGVELQSEAETACSTKFVVAAKKQMNLIKANAPLSPVKLRNHGKNEGNFIRYNLNGRNKRKFVGRGKNNNYSSSYKSSYRRNKRKLNADGQAQKEGTCEEDGLVTEISQDNQKRGGEKVKSNKAIEEAIATARNETSDENLVTLLNLVYGYDSFREGQLEAIKLVVSGESTMLVLPTGAGKSLCYQIPAMILPGITLVVSPLVALMIDQLKHLPQAVNGSLLCSSQTWQETSETLRLLQEGAIKVLFVSPERFLNEDFLSLFSSGLVVSLVVIDEAHCVSEWSHNFRPSFTRLRASMLRSELHVNCFLAMTATATQTTLNDVMSALEIPSTNLIHNAQLRENLQLSVSVSKNKMKDLLTLLRSSPFVEVKSIIIYCKFQFETDTVSKYLCDNNVSAKSYHGGLTTKDRSRTQDLFCSNKIRVVVATVAFGMGLDKRDVGAVIHYSLPNSLEEYVQEIGRAGRDGRASHCHLFYDDMTYYKLRSLMHSDGVDEYAVNKLLNQVFAESHGKVCSIIRESASRKFDMKEEVILTILTCLELGEVQYLRLLPQQSVTCTLNFHQTTPALLAAKDACIAAILKKSDSKHGQHVFDVPAVANFIGVTPSEISNQLQQLKLKGEITYDLKDAAYCYTVTRVPEDICSLSSHLTKWLSEVESCKVHKLDFMYDATVFALNKCSKELGCSSSNHTPCLRQKIMDYFNRDNSCTISNKMSQCSSFLRADVKVFLQSNSHAKLTPRAVARILHGIASPAYPSSFWGKTHFWGRYNQVDFQVVMEAAKAELMNFVGKDAV